MSSNEWFLLNRQKLLSILLLCCFVHAHSDVVSNRCSLLTGTAAIVNNTFESSEAFWGRGGVVAANTVQV